MLDFLLIPGAVRWIHIVAAMLWVGGALFIFVVLSPVIRGEFDRKERTLLFAKVGRRFNSVSLVALLLLATTGAYNGWFRLRSLELLFTTYYGQLLLLKLALVAVVIALTYLHSYRLTPKLESLALSGIVESPEAKALRGKTITLSVVQLILNLLVVFIAVLLGFV